MPAPENLTTQTPGEPTKPATTTETQQPEPAFVAKHKGGGRWAVVDDKGEWVGDFIGTQEEAGAEAQRLIDGGEPYKKPDETQQPEPQAQQEQPATKRDHDPETLSRPVLTPEGWLCPAPKSEG